MKISNKLLKRSERIIGVDVFSGSGGLSLGAEMAGVDVKFAVEVWPSAAATYKRNHPGSTVINKDIQEIDSRTEISQDENIFVIMGGPPCQGFSMSNQRWRTMDNPKNQLFKHFVRFVDERRTRQTLWRAVQMLTQKLCCQTIHDCPKVVPLHYESE